MYSDPANWGITEPMLTVLFAYHGKAIALSDDGELFYSELPEEFIFPGSVLPIGNASSIRDLSKDEIREINAISQDILMRYRFD